MYFSFLFSVSFMRFNDYVFYLSLTVTISLVLRKGLMLRENDAIPHPHRARDMCGWRRGRGRGRGHQRIHPDAAVLPAFNIPPRVCSPATRLGPEAPHDPHPAWLPPAQQPGVRRQHPCSRLQGIRGLFEADLRCMTPRISLWISLCRRNIKLT